jgi:hypothetical protein
MHSSAVTGKIMEIVPNVAERWENIYNMSSSDSGNKAGISIPFLRGKKGLNVSE